MGKNGDQHQEIACQEREEADTEGMQGENVWDQGSSWGNTEEHAENFSQDDNMRPEESRQEDYIRGNYDEQDHGKEEMDAENTSRQESDRMMEEEGMMSTDNAGGQEVEQMGNKEHLWQQDAEPAWQEGEGAAESNQQQEQMLEEKQSMQEENLPV